MKPNKLNLNLNYIQTALQMKTRISWFLAYALAIFTEYTVWTAFGGLS